MLWKYWNFGWASTKQYNSQSSSEYTKNSDVHSALKSLFTDKHHEILGHHNSGNHTLNKIAENSWSFTMNQRFDYIQYQGLLVYISHLVQFIIKEF